MNIDLESYLIFCKVAEYGSITKTAKKLYISQPAITQRINKLENYLNCKLFIRNTNGVSLTSFGKKLYKYLNDSIHILENTENIFLKNIQDSKKGKKVLKINISNEIDNIFIYKAIVKFSKLFPDITINIENISEDISLNNIANNSSDISFVTTNKTRKRNLQFVNVQDFHECFYTSRKYYNDNLQYIENNLWQECRFILPLSNTFERNLCNQYFSEHNISIQNIYEIDNYNIRKFLVSNNFGIAFGNSCDVKEELDSDDFILLNLPNPLPFYSVFAVTKKTNNSLINQFLNCLNI